MMKLTYRDHRADPAAWAAELGISREAVDLYLASDVFDWHVDSFIWHRIGITDLRVRRERGPLGRAMLGHVDFPRAREACLTGACWVITTNIAREADDRAKTFVRNLRDLRALFADVPDDFELVRNVAEYRRARAAGKHGAFVGIQGGNALDRDPSALDLIEDDAIVRVTLVHLSSSSLGVTSSPLKLGAESGLTPAGFEYVKRLDAKKILVDLAHIDRKGFFDALSVHDRSHPVVVTHTGVSAVRPHWRNLDDEQLRAIAATGGTVGVMYQGSFLGPTSYSYPAEWIVRHLEHICDTIGDEHASLGSDWDGAVITPVDMPTCLELPRLVQIMLDRGFSGERIRKILGGNALRVIEALRG